MKKERCYIVYAVKSSNGIDNNGDTTILGVFEKWQSAHDCARSAVNDARKEHGYYEKAWEQEYHSDVLDGITYKTRCYNEDKFDEGDKDDYVDIIIEHQPKDTDLLHQAA